MRMQKTNGFSIIELVIILVVIGIVGGLGYVFYNRITQPAKDGVASSSQQATPLKSIDTAADLDKASSQLDSIDVSDSQDINSLDSQAANF